VVETANSPTRTDRYIVSYHTTSTVDKSSSLSPSDSSLTIVTSDDLSIVAFYVRMSSPKVECPRRSRCSIAGALKVTGGVSSLEQQHGGHARRSSTDGSGRLVLMTRTAVISIIYLSVFYGGAQSVEGFAVVHSTPDDSIHHPNSEGRNVNF